MVIYYNTITGLPSHEVIERETVILRELDKAGVINIVDAYGVDDYRIYTIHIEDENSPIGRAAHSIAMDGSISRVSYNEPVEVYTLIHEYEGASSYKLEMPPVGSLYVMWAVVDKKFIHKATSYYSSKMLDKWLRVKCMLTDAEASEVVCGEMLCDRITVQKGVYTDEAYDTEQLSRCLVKNLYSLHNQYFGKKQIPIKSKNQPVEELL